MRLVVDTNVFVSAALKQESWPAHTIRWIERNGGLLKTSITENEIVSVLGRPRLVGKVAPIFMVKIRQILAVAEMVAIDSIVEGCRDPDDDKFLTLAVNGGADAIVSGDADLLVMKRIRHIPIVSPYEFCCARATWEMFPPGDR